MFFFRVVKASRSLLGGGGGEEKHVLKLFLQLMRRNPFFSVWCLQMQMKYIFISRRESKVCLSIQDGDKTKGMSGKMKILFTKWKLPLYPSYHAFLRCFLVKDQDYTSFVCSPWVSHTTPLVDRLNGMITHKVMSEDLHVFKWERNSVSSTWF